MEIAYKWVKLDIVLLKFKILNLNKSAYYYNINSRDNSIKGENNSLNKEGRTPGYSFDIKEAEYVMIK